MKDLQINFMKGENKLASIKLNEGLKELNLGKEVNFKNK
jgi:hypothetical protein